MSFHRILHSGDHEKGVRRLWRQHQQQGARGWKQRWRLWKLHREFDFTPADPETWDFAFPQGQIPNCADCQNNCCQGPTNTVLLRLVDVARFVDRGWTTHFTHDKPSFAPELLAQRPRLRAMTESFHWKVFPVLKQRANGTCTFLSAEDRCSIHTDRPWVCRTFPYGLDFSKQQLTWSPRCQWHKQKETNDPIARELIHANFHNFYEEKVRDMVMVRVYLEELTALGLTSWLNLTHLD